MEMIVIEIMVIEDWAGEDDIDWLEDRDGNQIMPHVEIMMVWMRKTTCKSVGGLM